MRDLQSDLRGFLRCFNESEGFIEIFARTADAVLRSDAKTRRLRLFGRGDADPARAAEHPSQLVRATCMEL